MKGYHCILARKKEKTRRRKKFIETQLLLSCVHTRHKQKDHDEMLPTLPLKSMFERETMTHTLPTGWRMLNKHRNSF